jgi:exopolyphosphatase/guanosine-5'-triphosphate,3'-diphosphate pyrophosphatase
MGTNSFHMIVCQATADRDHFEVITKVKEAVPFFRGALTAHYIDEAALRSALKILENMTARALERRATTVLAVATSAVREAKNGEETLQLIRDQVKLDARMISGKEEARLIYLGVLWSMPELSGEFAIVDIGGGSSEIILGNRNHIHFAESYKLGAARLTQRFFKKGEPTFQGLRELHSEVLGVLQPAAARIKECGNFTQLIGTSGTIQTLAKIDRVRSGNHSAELHGYKMSLKNLTEIVAYIEEASLSKDKIKGVSADRNQTILAGSVVLLEMMHAMGVEEVTVCSAALREGVVVDRFLQTGWLNGGLEQHKDPRSASVHNLLEKYHASFEHAEQVARLASEIFLQTKGLLHDYSEEVGHLLWSAAMLHDVGMFIGRNGHHKHSYYLIKNGGMLGHSEEEVAVIASIARYHRGSPPKEAHEAYYTLTMENRKLVSEMSSILRLAEALDRGHRQVVLTLKVSWNKAPRLAYDRQPLTLNVTVKPGESFESESWALSEKKDIFEQQFAVRLNLCVDATSPAQAASGSRQ